MDRSKLYTERKITVDFNPKDIEPEDRDESATLEVAFYPKAVGPKLRRAMGEMVDYQSEAQRLMEAVEAGTATPVELAEAEAEAKRSEKDFTQGLSKVIHSWSLTDNGKAIPFSVDALEEEGYEFIYTLAVGVFGALSPNPETETS